MAFFVDNVALNRIATALEELTRLYAMGLEASGITTKPGTDIGDIYFTDEADIARRDFEDAIRREYGLSPTQPIGVINPETGREWSLSDTRLNPEGPEGLEWRGLSGSWGFGVGAEGAEEAEPGAEEAWSIGRRTPPAAERQRSSAQPEGESRPDSGEEPERSAEEQRGEPS